jgi:hypothetical protein
VGEGNHTYGFTQRASTDYAFEQTMKFAEGLGRVGWDILTDDHFAGRVVAEFQTWRETLRM